MKNILGSELAECFGASNSLLTWLSFEDRSLSATDWLLDAPDLSIYVVHFHERDYDISKNHQQIKRTAGKRIKKDTTFDRTDQYRMFLELDRMVSLALEADRCFIDISCFPREALLILVFVLSRKGDAAKNALLLYSVAGDYHPSEPDQSKKWLSRGLVDISPAYGFRGKIIPGRSLAVIGLLGLDDRRFVEAVDALQPDHLSIGVGSTEATDRNWLYEKNAMVAKDLMASFEISDWFTFDCDSILKAKHSIRNQIEAFPDHNICIIPMNNKLSTVAVAAVGLNNRSVQICHGSALLYNMVDYSTRTDNFHCGKFGEIFL